MTKSEMHLHDAAFLGPGLLFLDQYFNSFIDEYLVLWISLVRSRHLRFTLKSHITAHNCAVCFDQILSLFDLVRYCVSVCNEIASHLHICVFKIKPQSTAAAVE